MPLSPGIEESRYGDDEKKSADRRKPRIGLDEAENAKNRSEDGGPGGQRLCGGIHVAVASRLAWRRSGSLEGPKARQMGNAFEGRRGGASERFEFIRRRRHHHRLVLDRGPLEPPFPPSGDLYYSLWNYSLYRNSIGLRMQPRRSRRTAPATAEALFGRALRDLRKEQGLSQETLAFESGYHPTYIGQLERGKKSPSLRTIMRLAAVLRIPTSEILKRVEAGLPLDVR